jgi:hypothetical protein
MYADSTGVQRLEGRATYLKSVLGGKVAQPVHHFRVRKAHEA